MLQALQELGPTAKPSYTYNEVDLFRRYRILRFTQPAPEWHMSTSMVLASTDCSHALVKRPCQLFLDSATSLVCRKQCKGSARHRHSHHEEVQELYGSFLPSYGLRCSRVCSGKQEMPFVHPLYADHASLNSTQHPFFAPPTPSSSPATTEGSSSSLEETGASPSLEVARYHGPTACERQQAQSFAGARHYSGLFYYYYHFLDARKVTQCIGPSSSLYLLHFASYT